MNAVITDNMYDKVELNHISHESPQSGHGGDRGIITSVSLRNHGGGDGAGLHDKPVANDDSSKKGHTAIKSESSMLRAEPTPGSYGISNS